MREVMFLRDMFFIIDIVLLECYCHLLGFADFGSGSGGKSAYVPYHLMIAAHTGQRVGVIA